MAVSLYQERSPAVHGGNPTAGFRNFIDWLTGTSRGELVGGATAGPAGVVVVEAYDGVIRETGSAGLATLGATNLWRTGQLVATSGPWIVIEFPGTLGTPFQVYFRIHAANYRVSYQLISNNDWATGAGADATPTEPATIVPSTLSNGVHYPGFSHPLHTTFRAWCDPGVCMFGTDDGSSINATFYYVGEVDDADAADALPFVLYSNVDYFHDGTYNRLSPVDGTTELTNTGAESWGLTEHDFSFMWNNEKSQYTDLDGTFLSTPVWPAWSTVAHRHVMGKLRYVRKSHTHRGARSTSRTLDRIYPNMAARRGALDLPWDSLTPYP